MNPEFEKMMKELKMEYVASIPSKAQDIRAHHQAKDREKLRDDFHKMKGTGKTYGLPEVTDLGELVEKLCLKSTVPLDAFIPQSLDLLAAIHKSRAQDTPYVVTEQQNFKTLKALLS